MGSFDIPFLFVLFQNMIGHWDIGVKFGTSVWHIIVQLKYQTEWILHPFSKRGQKWKIHCNAVSVLKIEDQTAGGIDLSSVFVVSFIFWNGSGWERRQFALGTRMVMKRLHCLFPCHFSRLNSPLLLPLAWKGGNMVNHIIPLFLRSCENTFSLNFAAQVIKDKIGGNDFKISLYAGDSVIFIIKNDCPIC